MHGYYTTNSYVPCFHRRTAAVSQQNRIIFVVFVYFMTKPSENCRCQEDIVICLIGEQSPRSGQLCPIVVDGIDFHQNNAKPHTSLISNL